MHGGVEGTKDVRRSISDWLKFEAGTSWAAGQKRPLYRLLGALRYQPPRVDKDIAMQQEVRNAASTLRDAALDNHDRGAIRGSGLEKPRQKWRCGASAVAVAASVHR